MPHLYPDNFTWDCVAQKKIGFCSGALLKF